jgi:hypothetical protein
MNDEERARQALREWRETQGVTPAELGWMRWMTAMLWSVVLAVVAIALAGTLPTK